MQELSYPARVVKLKFTTLGYRRNRGDAILAYKLMRAYTLQSLFPTVGPNSGPCKFSRLDELLTSGASRCFWMTGGKSLIGSIS